MRLACRLLMFSWTNVGFDQIFSLVHRRHQRHLFNPIRHFSRPNTVETRQKAKAASLYTALLLVPFGIATALIGMCSLVLFPGIKSINAMAALIPPT